MIKHISLINFLMHKASSIECNQVNWIVGREKQGKSSILEALQTAFCRRPVYFNDRAEGIGYLVRNGEKKAVVSAEMEDGKTLRASIPSDGKDLNLPGFDGDIIKACLRCGWILGLNETDQKKFFQDLLLEEFTLPQIGELLNTFDERFSDLGDRFLRYLEVENLKTDDLEKLAKSAQDGRRDIKKDLDKLDAQKFQALPDNLGGSVTEKDISKAEKQYEESIKKVQAEEDRLRNVNDIYNQKLQDWKSVEFSHIQIKKELEESEAEISSAKTTIGADLGPQMKKNEAELQKVAEGMQTLRAKMNSLTGDDPCPPGQCARVDLKKHNAEMTSLQTKQAELLSVSRKLTSDNNQSIKAKEAFKAAEARWERAKKRAAELKELPPHPASPDISTTKLEQLRNQRHMFNVALRQAREKFSNSQRAAELEKQIAAHANDLQECRLQVELFEALCRGLGPKGIKMQLLERRFSEFIDEVNAGLAAFGFTMKIDLEPWRIWIDAGDGIGWVTVLSESTKSRASIPLQIAVAMRRRFPCVGIDNHDLGPELRAALYRYLLTVPVQSFVVSTLDEVDDDGQLIIPEHPGTPGVALLYVENGTVKEILPEAQAEAA